MRPVVNKLLVNFAAGIGFMILAATVQAHPAPTTEVVLDVSNEMVRIKLTAPMHEWNLAAPVLDVSQQADDTTVAIPADSMDSVLAYLAEHFSVSTEADVAFELTDIALSLTKPEGHSHIVANMIYTPADEQTIDQTFKLNWTAIVHRVRPHRANVFIASDTEGSAINSYPTFLGKMHYQRSSLIVER